MLSSIMYWLKWPIAWVLYLWHKFFTMLGLPADSGWTWLLAIIGLVLVVRTALIPLFVKQIRSQRKMMLVQPEIKKIQEKYKGKNDAESRRAMTQEQMDVYKEYGTNPAGSCGPLLIQMPIFFALMGVLTSLGTISEGGRPLGPLDREVATQAFHSQFLGVSLSDTFLRSETLAPKLFCLVLILLMSASQFYTQHQMMLKNMPESALTGQMGQTQKIMLYVMPVVFAFSGISFPVGVLIYWFVSNVWTAVQQFIVIRQMPTPGTPAHKAWIARREAAGLTEHYIPGLRGHRLPDGSLATSDAKGVRLPSGSTAAGGTGVGGGGVGGTAAKPVATTPTGAPAVRPGSGQRIQPKRKKSGKRR